MNSRSRITRPQKLCISYAALHNPAVYNGRLHSKILIKTKSHCTFNVLAPAEVKEGRRKTKFPHLFQFMKTGLLLRSRMRSNQNLRARRRLAMNCLCHLTIHVISKPSTPYMHSARHCPLSAHTPIPLFFLHALTPLSTSAFVTPSLTNHIVTPNCSTFRFRLSSSKNSISSKATPLCF